MGAIQNFWSNVGMVKSILLCWGKWNVTGLSKVYNLAMFISNKNIVWFKITMKKAFGVNVSKSICDIMTNDQLVFVSELLTFSNIPLDSLQYNSLLTVMDVFSSPLNSITSDIGPLSSWMPKIVGMFLCVRACIICASFNNSLVFCRRHCFSTTRTFNLVNDFKMHRPYEPWPSINSFSLTGWSSDGSIKLTVANLLLGGPDVVFLSLIWNKAIFYFINRESGPSTGWS